MKKTIRRSMGIVMALALLLTGLLCVGTAQADNKVTFESTDKGTITVHKYLYDGNEGASGTGDDLGTSAPSNESLKNTNFKLVPIANATDAINYFKGESGVTYTENSTKIESASIIEATTDNNGKFEFANVPVGIYILEEYEAPAYIDEPYTKCVVSMPMTNGTGDEWNFDVHVYPKNNVHPAEVHLTKKDQKDSTKLLSNVKFELKKVVINADGEETLESVNNVEGAGITNLATGSSGENLGKLDIEGLPKNTEATYRLYETENENNVENDGKYIVNKNYIQFTVDAYNKITSFTTSNGEISADFAANELTITMTNDYPTIDKKVKDVDETDTANQWKDGTETDKVSFGTDETVDYMIDVYAPVNVAELGIFEIVDTLPEGQEIVASTIAFDPNVASFFTQTISDDDKTVTWTLNKATTAEEKANIRSALKGKIFTITYSAKFTESAKLYGNGNTNNVILKYSKEIDGGTDTITIDDSTTVYTYDYQITKTLDPAPTGTKDLSVVTFELSQGTKKLEFKKMDAGVYLLREHGTDTTTSLNPSAAGVLLIKGLDDGDYTLTETKTVSGYNLLTGTVPLTVTANTTITEHTTDINEQTIINKQGFELPQTGSLGFLLFCAAGLVLVLAGAGLMMSGRKRTIR